MNPQRWHQVEQIYNSVLERNPAERIAFLEKACAGDEALRKEVESLLACNDEAEVFIESPAMEEAAQALAEDNEDRNNLVGRTLLHYSLLERIGEGGMGVVYRAHDNHLNREVAIKVLPDIFAQDPQRLARFEREARAVAALSHPNILGIHDLCGADGVTFAVMELLDGETLRARLDKGALPVRKAIDYAIQMAQGLAPAHERGIVHRDLKPENVFITKEGRVKILDFGLAKLRRDTGSAEEASTSLTRPGSLMGTVGYMSPEQVRGQEVDARGDIFAFGAILYEMLSGQRAFQGNSEADTISAILKEDPPELAHLHQGISPATGRVVRRCLEKNPGERFQSARDLAFALEAVGSDSETPAPTGKHSRRRRWFHAIFTSRSAPEIDQTRRRAWAVVTTGVLLVFVATTYWINRRGAVEITDVPWVLVPLTSYPGEESAPSFSPDGNQVAFSWNGGKQDNFDIYIKQVGSESARQLTTDPRYDGSPAWSPDGQSIAFLRDLGHGKMAVMIIRANGGRERQVADLPKPYCWKLSWHPNSKWLATSDSNSMDVPSSIFLLSVETGEKRQLTSPPRGTEGDVLPAFSPDGRSLAFERFMGGVSEIYLLRVSVDLLPEGEPRQLTFEDKWSGFPAWMPDGKEIIYASGNKIHNSSLWRISASGSGKPKPLPFSGEDIAFDPGISLQAHRLAYKRMSWDINIWRCQIPAAAEKPSPPSRLVASTRVQESAQYSPDGRAIAYVAWASGSAEIWVCDRDGTNPSQLTHLGGRTPLVPHWSPDGKTIVFSMTAKGQSDLFVIPAQGGEIRQLTRTPPNERNPTYSRDGRWIYLDSDRSGVSEVWKMPADSGDAVQVTRKGGSNPLESLDGKTLFYSKPKDQENNELWKVPADGGDEIRILEDVYLSNFDVKQQGVYYVSQEAQTGTQFLFLFYDFARKKTRRIGTTRNWVQWGFTVSPDEQWILLTQGTRDKRADLMLVENFH